MKEPFYTFTVEEREQQIWDIVEELLARSPFCMEELIDQLRDHIKGNLIRRFPSAHRQPA